MADKFSNIGKNEAIEQLYRLSAYNPAVINNPDC